MYAVLIALAVFFLILIPLAPKLIPLIVRFSTCVHCDCVGNLLEKHFDVWSLFFRLVLLVITALLTGTIWKDLRE